MKRLTKIKLLGLFFIVISASCISWCGHFFNLLNNIENRSWDWRARLVADPQKRDLSIKLITIDQASLDYYEKEEGITWPWPRSLYIPVIRFLEQAGARGVAFDLLFTESSAHGVADDREFADALKSKMPVISAVVLRETQPERKDAGYDEFLSRQQEVPPLRTSYKPFLDVTLPYPEIIATSAGFGAVNGIADSDGIFRHVFFGGSLGDVTVDSLPLSLFRNLYPEKDLALRHNAAVRLHGPSGTYPEENIVNIISSFVALSEARTPKVDPAIFKDAVVFIGVDAPGLLDLRPTSLDKIFRGVEYNAAIFDNLLHEGFVQHAPFAWSLLLTMSCVVILASGVLFSPRFKVHLAVVAGVILFFLYVEYLAALNGFWLMLVMPAVSLIYATVATLGFQYQLEGKEHRFIKDAFGRYVSPKIIDKIVLQPESLALGGERRELTIFFSDIAGFTTLSEKMEPARLVSFLNYYLSLLTDIILASGGTLDKYEGDAIIAFWNAPLSIDDHARQGALAAKQCVEELYRRGIYFMEEYGVTPTTRIGLHTGVVTVGNFGSTVRFDYTMIGDAANFASRLEGANKFFGTLFIFSETTYAQCQGAVKARYLGKVQVVGKTQGIGVYEPILAIHPYTEAHLACFAEGVRFFEMAKLDDAIGCFKKLQSDPVAASFVEKLSAMRELPAGQQASLWRLDSK